MTATEVLLVLSCLTAMVATRASAQIHKNDRIVPSKVELDIITAEQQKSKPSAESAIQSTIAEHEEQCGIWLAPSTIPGAGLGMFAGREFAEHEVLSPTGDYAVAIVDIELHNRQQHPEPFLWDEYTWSGKALRLDQEGRKEVVVASAGFGAAVNCFLPILNVHELNPVLQWDGLQRLKDPGAGSSTQYHGRLSVAKRPIVAGEEFFANYGEGWFTSRKWLGPIPLFDDLDHASLILQKFHQLSVQNETLLADLWKSFITDSRFIADSRVLAAFRPDESPFELQRTYNGNMTAARIEEHRRNLEWLREHGTCGDHIVGGKSTIPQAGHGAYAARHLPKDTVVAQLPMIHVTNRSRFDIYHLKQAVNGTWEADESRGVVGQQLLLNYCYGHSESSLLLCPYGPMANYINHHKTMANVRLRWGRPETGNHMPQLLNATVHEIEKMVSTAKLAMELVPTRDIEKGEEILMDYGLEWETAWNAHVANWQPPKGAAKTAAAELNAEAKLRTVFEEYERGQYPNSVTLFCDISVAMSKNNWKEHYAAGTLKEYLANENVRWWPCEILRCKTDPTTGDILYTAHMFDPDKTGKHILNSILVEDVPRAIFHFVDHPYTSDAFLSTAFRHAIGIPDELFPRAWRNLIEKDKTESHAPTFNFD